MARKLAQQADEGAEVAQIADAIVATWQAIDEALCPIIGRRGVAALYKRSLYIAAVTHPWLAAAQVAGEQVMDFAALKSALAQQDPGTTAVGGGDLLQTFHELLTSLVGPSLTAQLLRSVWTNPSSGHSAQDTSP